MDKNTILGSLLAFGFVAFAISMGDSGLGLFLHLPSALIVIGGTLAVTMVSVPMAELKKVIAVVTKTAFWRAPEPTEEIARVVEYASVARREGLLSLENRLKEVDDRFMSKGIQLVIDGFSADTVRQIMELEAECERQRHIKGKRIFEQMGTYAPAFGMIGTLVGLVQMLNNLRSPDAIGSGMATALLTTFYGAICANVVCLPLAAKLDARAEEEALLRDLMVEGLVAIQLGEKPTLIKEKLKGFLAPAAREAVAA